MARMNSRFQAYNLPEDYMQQQEDVADYLCLNAPPDTILWRGRRTDIFSAPMVLLTSPVQSFQLMEVTVSACFDRIHDQAGLVIFFDMGPDEPWMSFAPYERRRRMLGSNHLTGRELQHTGRWVKAALQQVGEEDVDLLGLATVVAQPDYGPDQSISALPIDLSRCYGLGSSPQTSLRIKLERVDDALWVSYRVSGTYTGEYRSPEEVNQQWKRAREIPGFFAGMAAKSRVKVGYFASRPLETSDDDDSPRALIAEFEEMELLELL